MGNSVSKPIGLAAIATLFVPGHCQRKSTKSSKEDNGTYCSADTLTRADTVTNLVFANVDDENNEINQASIEYYCNAGPNRTAFFIQALGNSAGNLVDPQCAVQNMFGYLYYTDDVTVTEGEFQAFAINLLCYAERKGEVLPVAGCDYTNPCEVINGGLQGCSSDCYLYDDLDDDDPDKPHHCKGGCVIL